MGTHFSRQIARYKSRNQRRLLLVGLDGAGKTTILYSLRLGKAIHSIPTESYNVECFEYLQFKLNIWDVGGQDTLRPFWRHHYTGTQGIVFVFDSADIERIELAKNELHGLLTDEQLENACLLVLINKRDLPNVSNIEDIVRKLDYVKVCEDSGRNFKTQPTVALKGEGIKEGFNWLCENMQVI